MRWFLAITLAFAISGCGVDMDEYLDEARRLVDPAQRLWPGSREPAEPEEPPAPTEAEIPPEEPTIAQNETEVTEETEDPQEKGSASDPTRIVFRYTDDAGNLKFVTGIDNVPRKYRSRVKVVDGRKLNTYESGTPIARGAPNTTPTSTSSTLRGRPGGAWNSNQIRWVSLAQAKSSVRRLQRPALLVIYTDWCPHCANLEKQFEDQQVAELAQRFVMVHGNSDEMDELDRSYAPDGRYIPRMMVLSPTGKLDTAINDGGEHAYNWGSQSPKGILRIMRKAIKKYGN